MDTNEHACICVQFNNILMSHSGFRYSVRGLKTLDVLVPNKHATFDFIDKNSQYILDWYHDSTGLEHNLPAKVIHGMTQIFGHYSINLFWKSTEFPYKAVGDNSLLCIDDSWMQHNPINGKLRGLIVDSSNNNFKYTVWDQEF